MCYPMIIMGIGAAVSAAGQIQQGKAVNDYAQANAAILRQQGADAKDRAEVEAASIRRKGAQIKGRQIVQLAANGVSIMADDSSGDILADTEMFTELDALTALNNGERSAYYTEYSAVNELAKGSAARSTGYLSAAGTLLTTAGSMGSSFSAFKTDPNNIKAGTIGFGDFLLS